MVRLGRLLFRRSITSGCLSRALRALLRAPARHGGAFAKGRRGQPLSSIQFHPGPRSGRGRHCNLPGALATLGAFDARSAGAALAEAGQAHLQRKGIQCRTKEARAGIFPAVQIVRRHEKLRTTIVIPTRNRQRLLQDCIDFILPAVRRSRADLLIVDNETTDAAALRYFDKIKKRGAKVLRVPGSFNFSRLNNRAAEAARGDVLCLLNNDVKALDDAWLEEMLGRMPTATLARSARC